MGSVVTPSIVAVGSPGHKSAFVVRSLGPGDTRLLGCSAQQHCSGRSSPVTAPRASGDRRGDALDQGHRLVELHGEAPNLDDDRVAGPALHDRGQQIGGPVHPVVSDAR